MAGYGLFMLTLVYAFNFVDRQILVILQEPIKNDMGLSDAQLGGCPNRIYKEGQFLRGGPVVSPLPLVRPQITYKIKPSQEHLDITMPAAIFVKLIL